MSRSGTAAAHSFNSDTPMLYAILSIVGGLIAASSFVIARKPDAKELFDRLAPYQGFIGIGMLTVGILWLLQVLPHICLLYTSPSPRDQRGSRMPSSA